ncbi:MAG: nitrite reductase small subunit NirD [Myxococcales bacterium]
MPRFLPVLPLSELPAGRGRCVSAGGREVALFQVAGELFAIDNSCPHRGGPLSEGDLSGCVVYCPLHAWSFDLRTGVSPSNDRTKVATYSVRVVDGTIEVDLPEAEAAEAGPLDIAGPTP